MNNQNYMSSGKKAIANSRLKKSLDLSMDDIQPGTSGQKAAKSVGFGTRVLPEPIRSCEILKLFDVIPTGSSCKKTVKSTGLGIKTLKEPMRTCELLKLWGMEPSPIPLRAKKQLWSSKKSNSKTSNSQVKVKANKENIRKSIFPRPSSRRMSEMKMNAADETLPLIDMEALERNRNKLKPSLRLPQTTSAKLSETIPSKRQTFCQSKFVKPVVTQTKSTKSAYQNEIKEDKTNTKRHTTYQSKLAFRGVPEIIVSNCNDDNTMPRTVCETELRSIHDTLKNILSKMDTIEIKMERNFHCKTCGKCEKSIENRFKNLDYLETKTASNVEVPNEIENNQRKAEIDDCKTADELVATRIANITRISEENHVGIEESIIGEMLQNKSTEKVSKNLEKASETDNSNSVPLMSSISANSIAQASNVAIQIEYPGLDKQTMEPVQFTEVEQLTIDDQEDLCINFTLLKALSARKKRKSHFEFLEDELQNASITSLPCFDSDDNESPVFKDIDYDYLLGGKTVDLTDATTKEPQGSTGSNEAMRTYNDLRKCIPLLCTPIVSKHRNACLMTPSVQNSQKKLSRRIQEQLLKLNDKS